MSADLDVTAMKRMSVMKQNIVRLVRVFFFSYD